MMRLDAVLFSPSEVMDSDDVTVESSEKVWLVDFCDVYGLCVFR